MIPINPHFYHAYRYILLIVMSILLLSLSSLLQANPNLSADANDTRSTAAPTTDEQRFARLVNKANKDGEVKVIVQFKTPVSTLAKGGSLSPAQTAAINTAKQTFRQRMVAKPMKVDREYDTIPAMAVTVDADSLAEMQNDPNVLAIQENKQNFINLMNSTPLMNADDAQNQGFSGSGQTIAILDSGVDIDHPFLSGRVVAGACFSKNLCPNGVSSSTTLNSGNHCSTTRINEQCNHGTHVAGIAAGKGTDVMGVAPEANIIAVQVFSAVSCQTSNTGLCITGWDDDILAALEHIYQLRNSYNIAAVNMSLGGGKEFSTCDNKYPLYTSIINNLRSAGIATIISSGNEYFSNATGTPGCISPAITVGSSTSSTTRQYFIDRESDFSNAGSWVDVFAPGQLIFSSVSGGQYEQYQGTSMAAPQVAGAWAVLKSKKASATVSEIESALESTGKAISTRSGGTKPRIDVNAALNQLSGTSSNIPKATTLIAPQGDTADNTPTFTWNAESHSTYYRLHVNDSTTQGKIAEWYKAEDVGCVDGGICSFTPTINLADGDATWWVKTWNEAGEGPWSSAKNFKVVRSQATVPTAASLISPNGTIDDNAPNYRWNPVSNATWYYLYVNDSVTQGKIQQWYTANELGCSTGTCSITPTTTLALGSATWWIKAWNDAGEGPWSNAQNFTVSSPSSTGSLAKPTLVSPKNTTVNTRLPVYSWNPVNNATWYYLYVRDGANTVYTDWFSASAASCSAGICLIRPSFNLSSGSATWWVIPWNNTLGYGVWSDGADFSVR
ncbi:MAG: S8 family peptidase [bacterium]